MTVDLDAKIREPDPVSIGAARLDPAEPLPSDGAVIVALLGWFAGLRRPLLFTLFFALVGNVA